MVLASNYYDLELPEKQKGFLRSFDLETSHDIINIYKLKPVTAFE